MAANAGFINQLAPTLALTRAKHKSTALPHEGQKQFLDVQLALI
jgi:hypothetical protein